MSYTTIPLYCQRNEKLLTQVYSTEKQVKLKATQVKTRLTREVGRTTCAQSFLLNWKQQGSRLFFAPALLSCLCPVLSDLSFLWILTTLSCPSVSRINFFIRTFSLVLIVHFLPSSQLLVRKDFSFPSLPCLSLQMSSQGKAGNKCWPY